jgi:hypothetical protein
VLEPVGDPRAEDCLADIGSAAAHRSFPRVSLSAKGRMAASLFLKMTNGL